MRELNQNEIESVSGGPILATLGAATVGGPAAVAIVAVGMAVGAVIGLWLAD